MAWTKNTARGWPSASRYPLAEYTKVEIGKSIDYTNLHGTNKEFIEQLLHELIDKIISTSNNTKQSSSLTEIHEITTSNAGNKNVELSEENANKENELTQYMHDSNKTIDSEVHIQNIFKKVQENKKKVEKEVKNQ